MTPGELAHRIRCLLEADDDAQNPQFQSVDVDDRTETPTITVWLTDGTELFVEVHDA